MSHSVSYERMDIILESLKDQYSIYGPKYKKNNTIGYGEIDCIKDIVYDKKSEVSPKEVIYPVVQKLFYFKEDECIESTIDDDRDIILFARPCDINGIKRLDIIFSENGRLPDYYYERLRKKLKIFMIECTEGFENCFCVSMGANETQQYDVAVRFEKDGCLVKIKDDSFSSYFKSEENIDFEPEFIKQNKIKVNLPEIKSDDLLKAIDKMDFWKQYNDICLSCGRCNARCITCSCFDTIDIIYDETSRDGERRRVWSSCMLESFSSMAGGHSVRQTAGERMRFKTLHKIYDFNKRFGQGHMCIGCGRCDDSCSQNISFSGIINKLHDEIEALNKERI